MLERLEGDTGPSAEIVSKYTALIEAALGDCAMLVEAHASDAEYSSFLKKAKDAMPASKVKDQIDAVRGKLVNQRDQLQLFLTNNNAEQLERTLAALLYGAGRSDLERANVSVLLREAVENGWLGQQEFEHLDHARALRNPVTHFRRPLHEDTVEYRSVTLNEPPYSILEEDARHVMVAAFRVLARQTA